MTLMKAILRKVQSKETFVTNKYGGDTSPPPELDETSIEKRICKKRRKYINKYAHVVAKVDTSAPRLRPMYMFRNLSEWRRRIDTIYADNLKLVTAIKQQHFLGGRVDCHWKVLPKPSNEHYEKRKNFLKHVEADNKVLYQLINSAKPRVATAQSLRREWARNRELIIETAAMPFVLYPREIREQVEDQAFVAPVGVKRPRVHMTLRIQNGAFLGELTIELFTDVCPLTCALFTELLDGDGLGHGYVGTKFFRKVPHLYWSGGDVIWDNGFGCYAQKGRRIPIGAENYHFPHSMPGLVSMRMTPNDEMCGTFNITFKPLPQLDLKNVVFGRVVRPSSVYDTIESLGDPLGSQPVVRVARSRRKDGGRWITGTENERLANLAKRWKGVF